MEAALKGRVSSDPAVRAVAEAELAKLDRFLEPHVRRALARSTDRQVRASAGQVLDSGFSKP